MSDSDNDRRGSDRRLTCVVAEVEASDKSALALIRNVSHSGALLYVARDLRVDDSVQMVIHTSADPEAKKIQASGTIVRREALDPARTDVWRWEIGVRFADEIDLDDAEIERITKRLGGASK